MSKRDIPVGRDGRELTVRGSPAFPVATYNELFTNFVTSDVPWHWHAEIEVGQLVTGEMALYTADGVTTVHAGEGLFANANALHAMSSAAPDQCRLLTVVFDPIVVAGAPGSVFEQKYVLPFTSAGTVSAVVLRPGVAWQENVLRLAREIIACVDERAPLCELHALSRLATLWAEVLGAHQSLISEARRSDDEPIRQMLTFMIQHYMHPVTLGDIASSANLSERACTRRFHDRLGVTPFQHLTLLRVREAARLLGETEDTVTDICFQVGFGGTSYFGKVFKENTGLSPREYRAALQAEDRRTAR